LIPSEVLGNVFHGLIDPLTLPLPEGEGVKGVPATEGEGGMPGPLLEGEGKKEKALPSRKGEIIGTFPKRGKW